MAVIVVSVDTFGSFTGVFIPGIGSIPSAVLIVGSVRTSSGTSSNLDSGFVLVI